MKDKHGVLLDCDKAPFVLKGLHSVSIKESPVATRLNGKPKGSLHGIEIFEKVSGSHAYPQTVVDIVSNTYFRLTYQNPDGTSGTFGTSVIGTTSIRTVDGTLHLVPHVTDAEINVGSPHRLSICVVGHFGNLATVKSTRTYSTDACCSKTVMQVSTEFTALRDIQVNPSLRGSDGFRFVTISSMFANSNLYDGNVVSWTNADKTGGVQLNDEQKRNLYLFRYRQACTEFAVRKSPGSEGLPYTPGSADSPSIAVRLVESSIPAKEIGIQAFLAETRDVNDDSLSVWAEWLDCPKVIEQSRTISATFEVGASPPST